MFVRAFLWPRGYKLTALSILQTTASMKCCDGTAENLLHPSTIVCPRTLHCDLRHLLLHLLQLRDTATRATIQTSRYFLRIQGVPDLKSDASFVDLGTHSPERQLYWNRGVVVAEADMLCRSESGCSKRFFAARAKRELVSEDLYMRVVAYRIRVN